VCAGAVGNLIDRLRSFFGVVDFIDVGIGDARWPTFNVADMAVSIGAALLAWVLWQEDQSTQATAPAVSPVAVPRRRPAASRASSSDRAAAARAKQRADCSGERPAR
jgi:hypothetical protein